MNKIITILNTFTLAAFIHYYDAKSILYMLIGFLTASIFGYWKFKIVPTKKSVMYLIYAIILGFLLKLIF
jgi:hypothetical protein